MEIAQYNYSITKEDLDLDFFEMAGSNKRIITSELIDEALKVQDTVIAMGGTLKNEYRKRIELWEQLTRIRTMTSNDNPRDFTDIFAFILEYSSPKERGILTAKLLYDSFVKKSVSSLKSSDLRPNIEELLRTINSLVVYEKGLIQESAAGEVGMTYLSHANIKTSRDSLFIELNVMFRTLFESTIEIKGLGSFVASLPYFSGKNVSDEQVLSPEFVISYLFGEEKVEKNEVAVSKKKAEEEQRIKSMELKAKRKAKSEIVKEKAKQLMGDDDYDDDYSQYY